MSIHCTWTLNRWQHRLPLAPTVEELTVTALEVTAPSMSEHRIFNGVSYSVRGVYMKKSEPDRRMVNAWEDPNGEDENN